MNFSTQVHDFDPGITPFPSGLFWTVRLDDDQVSVQPGAGVASMRADGLRLFDYFAIPNALQNGDHVAATASFGVEFTGPVTHRATVRDAANGFEGRFVTTSAKMSWSASNANGFSFASDPIDTSRSVFAEIGEERNGRFFGGG